MSKRSQAQKFILYDSIPMKFKNKQCLWYQRSEEQLPLRGCGLGGTQGAFWSDEYILCLHLGIGYIKSNRAIPLNTCIFYWVYVSLQ